MVIYRPKVVQKPKSTCSGDKEHGAEVICLHEEDYEHDNDPDYFKNQTGLQQCTPLHASGAQSYFSFPWWLQHSAIPYSKIQAEPQKVGWAFAWRIQFRISYKNCLSRVTHNSTGFVWVQPCTWHNRDNRSNRTGTFWLFYLCISVFWSCRKRKRPTAGDPEEEEDEGLTFQAEEEEEAGPAVTITHDRQLKKDANQCFCGKGDFTSLDDLEKHKVDAHIGKGQGTNRKTGKPKRPVELQWMSEECGDNRACWKHFRTKHLGLFIHYCPVAGCGKGNDQKDTIISHIRKEHPQEKELINLCAQQSFLKCKSCNKVFRSVKGKNIHEQSCGLPVVKKSCPFENCFKTYKSQERMDNHIQTVHEGKGHKCLCPVCGYPLSSQQALTNHLQAKHGQ